MLTPESVTRTYLTRYPRADERSRSYREALALGKFDWPSWCFLPVAASMAIIEEETRRPGSAFTRQVFDDGNLAAVLAWRMTKGIYRFDPDLLASLWSVELDRQIPADIFFSLPAWCCYIDLDGVPFAVVDNEKVLGFFVYLDSDAVTGTREIRLAIVHDGPQDFVMANLPFVIDSGCSLNDMFRGSIAKHLTLVSPDSPTARQLKALPDEEIRRSSAMYAPLFNLVLYLCSKGADILAPAKTRPVRVSKNPKKQKKNRRLPVEYRVGTRIGAALRQARESSSGAAGSGSRKSPHIRKPHWHLYWTGKGRAVPVVKFMDIIPVNVGKEPNLPVVYPVGRKKGG